MKKGGVFFHPIDGSAPLSISWYHGPKGDAVEAKNGLGVGFFSPTGELLAVIFDDVSENKDHQVLTFDRYQVEIATMQKSVTFHVNKISTRKKSPNKGSRNKKAA